VTTCKYGTVRRGVVVFQVVCFAVDLCVVVALDLGCEAVVTAADSLQLGFTQTNCIRLARHCQLQLLLQLQGQCLLLECHSKIEHWCCVWRCILTWTICAGQIVMGT
jgi:hypothetical protein